MEKNPRELESIINAQKEQLTRYEIRLRDVINAYKGLLKEKEALQASLKVTCKDDKDKQDPQLQTLSQQATTLSDHENTSSDSGDGDLQMQIATVMNSLATLSAEKSRMEASFQADKKQLRQEMNVKDKLIKELQEKVKSDSSQNLLDLEKIRSRLIVEKHERETDNNDHMIRIRELQKLLSDERHLKEHLEMQLNDLKNQFSQSGNTDARLKELTNELENARKKIRELQNLKATRNNQEKYSPEILKHLQQEIVQLKHQHSIAIRNEQQRGNLAEERNKKLAAMHENRVANLESRLAELSETVGTYDRLRQTDQDNILKLKEKIAQFTNNNNSLPNEITQQISGGLQSLTTSSSLNSLKPLKSDKIDIDLDSLIDEIATLKKILIIENAKSKTPRDLSKLFSNVNTETSTCNDDDDYQTLLIDFQHLKDEIVELNKTIDLQKNHIITLQDKVKVLNRNIDEQEDELKRKSIEHLSNLKAERNKWKEILSSREMDLRSKVAESEQQLQKQRERSVQLLEEKENEIKTLKTSFEVFYPIATSTSHSKTSEFNTNKKSVSSLVDDDESGGSGGGSVEDLDTKKDSKIKVTKKLNSSHLNTVLNTTNSSSNNSTSEPYHMLHYVHELARKDVEITSLRKSRHVAETSLRQALQDKVTAQEELHDKISFLEEHVDRLERCKSREGANLEYLKNVILSFLISNDKDSKSHMVNAIGAVLKFSPNELKIINTYFTKKDNKK